MSRVIRFEVLGKPQPQGSTRAFIPKGWKRAVITTDNTRMKPWRQEVGQAALMAVIWPKGGTTPAFPVEPVELTVRFYFARPKSASVKKRPGHTVKPDVDKLLRATLDSLTGILYADDAQVVETHCRKHYGGPERVEIELREAIV